MIYAFSLTLHTPGDTFDMSSGVINFTYYSSLFDPSTVPTLVDAYKIGLYSFDIMYDVVKKTKGSSKVLSYLKLSNPYQFYKSGAYYEFGIYDIQEKNKVTDVKQGRELFTIRLIPYHIKNLEQPRQQFHLNIVTVSMLPLVLLDLVYKYDTYFKSIIIDSPDQVSTPNILNTVLNKTKFYQALDVPTFYFFAKKKKLNTPLDPIKIEPVKFKDKSVYIGSPTGQLKPIITFSGTVKQQPESKVSQQDYEKMIEDERNMLNDNMNQLDKELNKLMNNDIHPPSLLDRLNSLQKDLSDLYSHAMNAIDGLKNDILNAISSAVHSLFNNIPGVTALTGLFNDITSVFNGISNGINDMFSFMGSIFNDLSSVLSLAADIVNIGSLINNVLAIPSMIANYLASLPSYLLSPLLGVINSILSQLGNLLQQIGSLVESCYQNNTSPFGQYNIPSRYSGSDSLAGLVNFSSLLPLLGNFLNSLESPFNDLKNGVDGLLGRLGNILSTIGSIGNTIGQIPDAIIQGIANALNAFPNILAPIFNLFNGLLNLAKDICLLPAKLSLLGDFLDRFVKPDFLKAKELTDTLNDTREQLKKHDEKEMKKKNSKDVVHLSSNIQNIVFTYDKEEIENSEKLNKSVPKIKEKTHRIFPTEYVYSYYSYLYYNNTLAPSPLLTYRSFVFSFDTKTLAVRHRIYRPGRQPDYIIQLPKFFTKWNEKDLDIKPQRTLISDNVLVFDSNPIVGEGLLEGNEDLIIISPGGELPMYVTKFKYVEIPVVNLKTKGTMRKGKFTPTPFARYKIPMDDILENIPFVDDKVAKELISKRYSDDTLRIYEDVGTGYYSNLPCLTLREFMYTIFNGQVIQLIHHNLEYMYKLNVGDVVDVKFGDNVSFSSYEGLYLVISIEANGYNGMVGSPGSSPFSVSDAFPKFKVTLMRPIPHMMNKEYNPNKGPSKLWNIGNYLDNVIV